MEGDEGACTMSASPIKYPTCIMSVLVRATADSTRLVGCGVVCLRAGDFTSGFASDAAALLRVHTPRFRGTCVPVTALRLASG